jgi:uncharacterized protein YjdB
MRLSSRALGFLWFAVAAVALTTCSEFGPARSGLTRLTLRPYFAAASISEGPPITRIVISAREVRDNTPIGLYDRAVHPNAASWDIAMDVRVEGTGARDVVLAIELFDDTGNVQWSGIVVVSITPGIQSDVGNVALYPGPLAPVASIEIQPKQLDLPLGEARVLDAIIRDSSDNVLSRAVTWTSSDTNVVIVSMSGVVNGRAVGTASITASVEGKSDTASVTVYVPVPASIELASGDGQSGAVSTQLTNPVVVLVRDQHGNGVGGQQVTWGVTGGSGSTLGPDTTVTDVSGYASSQLTLGPTAGTYTAEARATGLTGSPVVFTATAVAQPQVSFITLNPGSLSLVAGDTATITATAYDTNDNVIPNAPFTWRSTDTLRATVNSAGLVTVRDSGSAWVVATSGSASDSASVTVSVGPATTLSISSGNGQSAYTGDTLANPIVVIVSDRVGNRVGGVTVDWSVVTGGGSLDVSTSQTNANGLASAHWTLGPSVGQQVAQASSAGLANSPVQFNATAGSSVITRTWIGGDANGPDNWSVANNWSPVGVPSYLDTAIVPVTANSPRAYDVVSVGPLTVQTGAIVDNGGYSIAVTGSLLVDGSAIGSGNLIQLGSGVTVRGTFTNLNIEATSKAVGAVTTSGTLLVMGGNLNVNGKTIQVGGDFETASGGTIGMTRAADVLYVQGNIVFANTNETGRLTAGTIHAQGDFSTACYNSTEFVSTGTLVQFDRGNAGLSHIFMCSSTSGNRFHDMTIAAGTDVVTADNPVVVDSLLTISGNLTVDSTGVVDVVGPAGSLILNSGSNLNIFGHVYANLPYTDNGGTVSGQVEQRPPP